MTGRTVQTKRVIDNDTGRTIATIHPLPGDTHVELRTPDGDVIGTALDTNGAILFHLQISGY